MRLFGRSRRNADRDHPPNESLQLTGACMKEGVVVAHLALLVYELHLAGPDVARS
jgi:hypothetical protein